MKRYAKNDEAIDRSSRGATGLERQIHDVVNVLEERVGTIKTFQDAWGAASA